MSDIKILVVNPMEGAEVKVIETGYEAIREELGGYLEHIVLTNEMEEKGIVCYGDEEGKLKGLIPNMWCFNENYGRYDFISGKAIFVGDDGEGGDVSLNDEQIHLIKEYVNKYSINNFKVC